MNKLTSTLLVALCAFCVVHVQAQIIQVPGDYPTIQLGINAADPGDTVLVADGLYYENISFLGKKPLMVASQFLMDGDTIHIENTIIDGSQYSDIDNASVVAFKSGEDTTSILMGFTIRGGRGTWDQEQNNRCGGGIYISGSGARILHNRITENTVDDTQAGNGQETYGGGIGTSHDDGDYWAVIEYNRIFENTAVTKYGWAAGAGIYDSYNARVAHNIITGNHSLATTNGWGSGGGLSHLDLDGGAPNTLVIRDNLFYQNIAESVSGLGVDGATSTVNVHLFYQNNQIFDNTGITPAGHGGGLGGLSIINPSTGSIVSGNTFRENHGTYDGGAIILENAEQATTPNPVVISDNYFLYNEGTHGGAVKVTDIPVLFQNNVFNGNQATNRGGAVTMEKSVNNVYTHLCTFINNTFTENSAVSYGGAINSIKARPLIFNSIFYNDTANNGGPEIYSSYPTDTMVIAYCNIKTSLVYGTVLYTGINIDSDPAFLDEFCNIDEFSPCEDHGADSAWIGGTWHYAPGYDIGGIQRPYHEGTDIGAHECDIITGVPGPVAPNLQQFSLDVYPNPTTGKFQITNSKHQINSKLQFTNGTIEIVDYLGNSIEKWNMEHGTWNMELDISNLPSGIYFIRVNVDNETITRKIIKL